MFALLARSYLFICVIVILCKCSSCCDKKKRTYEKWGCKFQKFSTSSYAIAPKNNASNQPYWSKKTITPIGFDTVENFMLYLNLIRESLRNLVDKENFNNIGSFTKMYIDFHFSKRNISDNSFKSFFKSYRPVYKEKNEEVSQCINAFFKISEKLKSSIPTIGEHMFLCSGLRNVPAAFVKDMNRAGDGPFDFRVNYFDHILGAIKFYIGSACILAKRRHGLILLEPGRGISDPIVVMEDGMAPHGEFGPYGAQSLEYIFLPNNKNFIISRPKSANETKVQRNGTSNEEQDDWLGGQETISFWKFVGKSYCSFLDTTYKYDLLSPTKSEIKRLPDGKPLAGLYFSILPKDKEISEYETQHYGNISRPYFVLFMNDVKNNEIWRHPISFESLNEPRFEQLKVLHPKPPQDEDTLKLVKTSLAMGYSRTESVILNLETQSEILKEDQLLADIYAEQVPKFKNGEGSHNLHKDFFKCCFKT